MYTYIQIKTLVEAILYRLPPPSHQAVEEGYAGERSVSIVRVPRWVSDPAVWLATKVTAQKTHGPAHFISEASKHDMSAPNFGTRRLLDHYREKVGERKRREEETK